MIRDVQLFRSATLLLLLSTIAPAQPVTRLIYGGYFPGDFNPASIDGAPVIRAAAAGPDRSTVVANVENRIIPTPPSGSTYAYDASVTKLGADGKKLFSITLSNAIPIGIAVDANSNTYICGTTFGDFHTTAGVFQTSGGTGFVAKLDPNGTVVWASRISASPYAIAVDSSGVIYLTGTAKSDFQTTPGSVQTAMAPQQCTNSLYGGPGRLCTDVFIAKVSTDGASLLYATFLGGTREEFGNAIAIGPSGGIYVAGETFSADFPVTGDAYQSKVGGVPMLPETHTRVIAGGDAFLAALDRTGRKLLFSTYLGGANIDFASGVAVDSSENVYVTGTTASSDFPVTSNAYQTGYGGPDQPFSRVGDAFFASFDALGKARYVSYSGGSGWDFGRNAALGNGNRLYFLQDQAAFNGCSPTAFVMVVDTATGRIVDREGVPQFSANNGSLAIDSDGVIALWGRGSGYLMAFASAGFPNFGGGMFARIDFTRRDEFDPWCVANAASYALSTRYNPPLLPLAPGEIISIFGVGIGPEAKVLLGTREIPVLYSDANQINASVPYGTAVGAATLTIERDSYRASYAATVTSVFPGFFKEDGTHVAAINRDGTVNSAKNPAPRGSIIALYATGLGPLDNNGQVTTPVQPYIEATNQNNAAGMVVSYAGQAPGLPIGGYQINVRIPDSAKLGEPQITLFYGEPLFEQTQSFTRIFVRE